MNNRRRRGARRIKIAAASCFSMLALFAVAAPASNAALSPFTATFDNAFLKLGGLPGNGLDILSPTDPAPTGRAILSGQIETSGVNNGNFTVPAAGFIFPPFSGTPIPGVTVGVNLTATAPITGNLEGGPLNPTPTGKVVANQSTFLAQITLTTAAGSDACTIGDDPMTAADEVDLPFTFSTETDYPSPYKGDRFTVNLTPPSGEGPLQDGAIVTTWTGLPTATAAPGDDCSTIDGLTGGRGGLWIADGLTTPAATTAPPSGGGGAPAAPAPAPATKCKKGFKKVKGKCKKAKKKKKK